MNNFIDLCAGIGGFRLGFEKFNNKGKFEIFSKWLLCEPLTKNTIIV